MNSLIKRTVSAVMVAVLVTATAPMLYENESVYAETVQDKINKARKEKQAAQAAKTEAKGKMQDAMAQITKLDDEADVIRAELSAIDAIISEADAKIEAKEAEIAELEAQAERLRKYGNVMLLRTDAYEVSSTEIREKIKNNSDVSCYMNENVVKYILENKLYTD